MSSHSTTRLAIPPTDNPGHGFWGTMDCHAEKAWPIAMRQIAQATMLPYESVHAFLDSVFGRHFADEVRTHLMTQLTLDMAIAVVVERQMNQPITRSMSWQYQIPVGTPSLIGLVVWAEVNQ